MNVVGCSFNALIPVAWVDWEPFSLCSYMLCLPPLLPPLVYHIGPHSSPSFLLLSPDPLHYCFPASNQVSRVVITFPSLLTVAHLPLATLCVCVFVFACLCVCVCPWWLMAGHWPLPLLGKFCLCARGFQICAPPEPQLQLWSQAGAKSLRPPTAHPQPLMSVTVFLMSPFLMPLTSCRHLRLTLVSACLFHATFFYNHHFLHPGLITLLIGLALIVGSSLATAGPFPFTRSHVT